MKKTIIISSIIIFLILIIQLTNNNSSDFNKNDNDKIVALSTFTIIADMVSVVGGDKVESVSLTKPGAEIHGYEVTPSDLVRASKADIIFENGMGLEMWAQKLRANIPDVTSVVVSEGVEVVSIKEGDYQGKPNPHAWMSPRQAVVYVENIRKALIEFSPEDEDYFSANADAYIAEILEIDEKFRESLAQLPEGNRYLVTCEGAFTYLTNDYGLEEIYIWAINDENEGSPQQIVRVINLVKEKQIPAVFCESTVEPRIQQEVVRTTDAKFGGLLYVDSLSAADGPAPTYLKLLEITVETIIAGLTQN